MNSRILAAFVAAFIALFAFEAEGQTANTVVVPTGLPASLPMFSTTNEMLDWVVGPHPARLLSYMRFFYTAKDGTTWNISPYFGSWTNFSSYSEYKGVFIQTMLEDMSEAIATNADVHGPVKVFNVLQMENGPYTLSQLEISNSTMTAVTSNWLATLDPTVYFLQVPIAGLQEFKIQVNGLYTNVWNGNGRMPTIPPYPLEATTDGWLALNPWYCLLANSNEERFTVTANGMSQTYTQTGAALLPPVLNQLDPNTIQVNTTSGSDTILQYKDSLSDSWQSLLTIPGLSNTGSTNLMLNQTSKNSSILVPSNQRYFRASSY